MSGDGLNGEWFGGRQSVDLSIMVLQVVSNTICTELNGELSLKQKN